MQNKRHKRQTREKFRKEFFGKITTLIYSQISFEWSEGTNESKQLQLL